MVSPNNVSFCRSPTRGIDQADAFAERKSGADDRKASGFTYVHSYAVGALPFGAFFPFDLEFHA
jgi:hypothetical protein